MFLIFMIKTSKQKAGHVWMEMEMEMEMGSSVVLFFSLGAAISFLCFKFIVHCWAFKYFSFYLVDI
jgi:hypothetical protein